MPNAAIEIDHVSKRFVRPLPGLRRILRRPGPDFVDALSDVSLRVEAGEVFGLVGRNGQGKTTLIKSTCSLLEPSAGNVRVFGHDSVRDLREVKRCVGLVSADERSFYFRLSGRENLRFFARLSGLSGAALDARIDTLVSTFELSPVIDRHFQEYSTGNKQRLAIVRALLPDPPLLLLDEPTRSLDPISAEGLRRVVSAWASAGAEKTVLITTHNLAEIEQLCGRVAILSRGKLIECASLLELKRKYMGEERVQLRVSGASTQAFVDELAREVGPVALAQEQDGRLCLTLSRRADDEKLHALLSAVQRAGLRVVGCDTEHFGLMQVLERIESAQAVP